MTYNLRQGKYRTIKFCISLASRSLSSNKYISNNLKMEIELPEPKRPPYECGSSIDKSRKAEKTMEFFNRARTSFDSVLNLFKENKDDHDQIPVLLETFKDIHNEYHEIVKKKNYPLIVFEGLDGSGKSSISKRFAKNVGAEILPTPPKSLSFFREKFDGHYCWHAPFYYFGNYVAAIEVAKVLEHQPVVMDRFWHSTTAFALAQMREDYFDVMETRTELPEKGNSVYEWPEDLIKPDCVIFLDVSEKTRMQRLSKRTMKTGQEGLLESKHEFRKNVLLAYQNMANPSICKVNANSIFKNVLQKVDEKVKFLF